MANAARLEIEVPFGGKTYTVRPTFAVIAGIEGATGQACTALARKCYAVDPREYPSIVETGQMLFNLLKPFDKDLTAERVGDVLLEDGCGTFWPLLGDILSRALKGNKDHLRQAELAAQKVQEESGVENPPPPPLSAT